MDNCFTMSFDGLTPGIKLSSGPRGQLQLSIGRKWMQLDSRKPPVIKDHILRAGAISINRARSLYKTSLTIGKPSHDETAVLVLVDLLQGRNSPGRIFTGVNNRKSVVLYDKFVKLVQLTEGNDCLKIFFAAGSAYKLSFKDRNVYLEMFDSMTTAVERLRVAREEMTKNQTDYNKLNGVVEGLIDLVGLQSDTEPRHLIVDFLIDNVSLSRWQKKILADKLNRNNDQRYLEFVDNVGHNATSSHRGSRKRSLSSHRHSGQ